MSTADTSPEDRNLWPGLTFDDALAARTWLRELGFTEGTLVQTDDVPESSTARCAGPRVVG